MRRLALLLLVGCAGAAPPASTSASERPRPELSCVERPAFGEAACVARGCSWRRPLFCSGIAAEPLPPDPSQTCTCVCADDELRCSMVP